MKKYSKRKDLTIIAVQLDLEVGFINYVKWGSSQHAKKNDWVVNNAGECYTIDNDSFNKTYKMVSPGVYYKVGNVWAQETVCAGHIETKEGFSNYFGGDYIVYNNEDLTDGYCMSAKKFKSMYEEV